MPDASSINPGVRVTVVLAALPAVRRVAILGDMYELGENSSEMHEAVGKYAAERGINLIITVNELAEDIGYGVARHMATNIFSGAGSAVNLGVSNPLEALASLAKSGNATCSEPCRTSAFLRSPPPAPCLKAMFHERNGARSLTKWLRYIFYRAFWIDSNI